MGWAITGRLILLVKKIDFKQVYMFGFVYLDRGYNGVSTMKTWKYKKEFPAVKSHLPGLLYKSTIKIE